MNKALKKSLLLHVIAFVLFMIDLPMFWFNRPTPGQVPIIVDLQDVKISEMTNLPPKAKIGKKEKPAKAKTEPKTEVNEEPQKPKKDFLVAPQPKKPAKKVEAKKQQPKPPAKPQKKAEPKKVPPKDKSKPELANPLKSLLASVDALEKNIGEKDATATIKEGTEVNNMGIEGGTGGSYFSELTISEMDALAGRLRACWNLDPGAMGIEDMIVEIRAQLNQDGTVRKVDILDSSRYGSDNHFRSVADSARRAVYICQPYSILADKYPEKYDMWKTLLLRFNPMDASIQ